MTNSAKLRRIQDKRGRTLFYIHPHGYRIKRQERDWDWVRGSAGWTPKVYWEVKRSGTRSDAGRTFRTLSQAREWCDRQDRYRVSARPL